MEIDARRVGDVDVVVLPVEELDATNASQLTRAVAPLLETSTRLVLDLHRLRFADSAGLGALLSYRRTMIAHGGQMRLCAMSESLRVLFALVRLHRVFEMDRTQAEAIRAFADGDPIHGGASVRASR